ncbi:cyclic nucleotide-binding domain-containing protein [Aquimarina rhabdastrellae]
MFKSELPNTIIKELSTIGIERTLKSHHSLIQLGEKVNELFLVLDGGLVLLHVHPKTMVERAINFFTPNFHPIASIAEAFYLNEPSKYHLKTFTNTTVIHIKKEDFNHFLQTSKHAAFIQDYGIKTLLEKNAMRAQLISLDSLEMFQYLHLHYPQILQHIPSKYIANFLGISPQWLSRLKHKL